MVIVLLHRTLKTFAFGLADDVDELTDFKGADRDIGAGFGYAIAEFADKALRGGRNFGEVPGLRLVHPRGFLVVKADLHRDIAVGVGGFDLEDFVPGSGDDRDRRGHTLVVVDAGHAEFFTE